MATEVEFQRVSDGEIKKVKIGWSWTLCIFGAFPFFFRKQPLLGLAVLGISTVSMIIAEAIAEETGHNIQIAMTFGLAFALGRYGNKISAENYLKNGWELAEPESAEAEAARAAWGLE